jgi:hypothetical protein
VSSELRLYMFLPDGNSGNMKVGRGIPKIMCSVTKIQVKSNSKHKSDVENK